MLTRCTYSVKLQTYNLKLSKTGPCYMCNFSEHLICTNILSDWFFFICYLLYSEILLKHLFIFLQIPIRSVIVLKAYFDKKRMKSLAGHNRCLFREPKSTTKILAMATDTLIYNKKEVFRLLFAFAKYFYLFQITTLAMFLTFQKIEIDT